MSYNGIAPVSIPGDDRKFGLPVDPTDYEWVASLYRPSEVKSVWQAMTDYHEKPLSKNLGLLTALDGRGAS